MPTPVTGRCNLHSAATYGQPIGVRCRSCERRVLVPLDKIGGHGDMTRCGRCRSSVPRAAGARSSFGCS